MLPDWFAQAVLWLVLDERAAAPRSMLEATRQALAGGVDAVVFRHRHAPVIEVLDLGKPIRRLCAERGVPFILSHYPELARELQPDALQLGAADQPASDIRQIVGQGLPLGYSAHSLAEVRNKLGDGYDYCVLGPIYPTPEKLKYGQPLGIAAVTAAHAEMQRLVFIGGITESNTPELLAAGATRIAVISAIQRSPDPMAAAAGLKRRLRALR